MAFVPLGWIRSLQGYWVNTVHVTAPQPDPSSGTICRRLTHPLQGTVALLSLYPLSWSLVLCSISPLPRLPYLTGKPHFTVFLTSLYISPSFEPNKSPILQMRMLRFGDPRQLAQPT